jgi:hypothetical protein
MYYYQRDYCQRGYYQSTKSGKIRCAIVNSSIQIFKDEVQGGRRAKTGMYVVVHEDCEHRPTKEFTLKNALNG